MQQEVQNVHIIRSGGSFGSKPPILPKPTRTLRTPDTAMVQTPIGKDSDCGTQQTITSICVLCSYLLLLMCSTFAVPDQQRKLSVTSDYSTGSGSFGDTASFLKVRLPNTVKNGMECTTVLR